MTLDKYNKIFFIGVAGTGMSALAQYLVGTGKKVNGSDRYFIANEENETKIKLEAEGIGCFLQDGSGIDAETDLVVASTAIEDTVFEIQKAKQLNIPIMRRSEMLSLIAASKKTIAIGGTSGKSSTCGMLFDILTVAGLNASIISGAGLVSLIHKNKIGNAFFGSGDLLVIEADESDGSIVQYKPEIGLLLNLDKDHKEIDELIDIFNIFKSNSNFFISNQTHPLAAKISSSISNDFSTNGENAGLVALNFEQKGLEIFFTINDIQFKMNMLGAHNMENATAAIACALKVGVSLETCSKALQNYEGIYRRHQIIGEKNGIWLIDDYAHNPAKCAASIKACQPISNKVIAWFQPHGYTPTKFLRADFVSEIAAALRPNDEIWMSEIFYAGGTAIKDISANDLINDLKALGKNAFFIEDRKNLASSIKITNPKDAVVLLMGARDPSLEYFAKEFWNDL